MKTKNATVKEKSKQKSAIQQVPAASGNQNEAATEKKNNGFRSVNLVTLTGYLGTTPTVLETKSGRKKAFFTLATNHVYLNKAETQVTETLWHSLVAWGSLAEIVGSTIKIGDRISVTGRINNRSYTDSNGVNKIFTEIVLRSFEKVQPVQTA